MAQEYKESAILLKDNHKIKPDGFINEVLRFADSIGIEDITNLKIQKLLY